MTHKVLIDYNRRGWAEEKESKIKEHYPVILHVGVDQNPSANSTDLELASFCEENNCDLLTGDKRAYASLLQNEYVKAVQISKYDFDETAKQQVYLVKIL